MDKYCALTEEGMSTVQTLGLMHFFTFYRQRCLISVPVADSGPRVPESGSAIRDR